MKFTINKKDVSGVLANIQGLTGRRSNLAITESVLIKVSEAGVTFVATDLETGFEGTYPATVETEGTTAINARKLYEIIRDFPNDEILVNEVDNRWIEIGSEKILYHIVGMNPEEFPETPKIEEVDFFEIDADVFKRMIEKTVAISSPGNEKRAHILGVCCECFATGEGKFFRLVSTDGSRLAKVDHRFEDDIELIESEGVLIPKKGLAEVGKFLEPGKKVRLGIKHHHFIVQKENETIVIRLLEGDFPEYNDIIIKKGGIDIPIERQMFLMMLRRMSILSSENYKSVIFHFKEDKLEITTTNPDIGESKEDMDVAYRGEPIDIAFNPKFFIDTLNVIEEKRIILNIVDNQNPCLIEPEEEKNYLSVIMPMRI